MLERIYEWSSYFQIDHSNAIRLLVPMTSIMEGGFTFRVDFHLVD